jgi:hypothetical protein
VAAAREGIKVALVEPMNLVGGMMSSGLSFSDSNQTDRRTVKGLFEEVHLRIVRNGKMFERYVTPIEETVRSRDGGRVVQGRVGVTHAPFVPLVGVIDNQSPAAAAGLRTGDLIISVDGQPVRNWSDVQQHLGRFVRRTSLVYFRGTEVPGVPQVQLLSAGFADLVPETQIDDKLKRQSYTGLEHAEMFVAQVDQRDLVTRDQRRPDLLRFERSGHATSTGWLA